MYRFVTSFSPKGYEVYGKRFLETWPKELPLTVYYEGTAAPDGKGVEFLPLDADLDLKLFQRTYDTPAANGFGVMEGKPVRNYNHDAMKFAKKVFAVTDFGRQTEPWRIWIDADVETIAPPEPSEILPDDKYLVYIGRRDWHHSECGFVGYNLYFPMARAFLKAFRSLYISGQLFALEEWHDSFAFDYIRREFANWQGMEHNLADGIGGMHPWPETVLGKFFQHHKGPKAKKETYGVAV